MKNTILNYYEIKKTCETLGKIITPVSLILFLLITVAIFTVSERKGMAAIQRRLGPNVVGWGGLLQPLADGLKLILKEIIIPKNANNKIFLLGPILTFTLSLIGWGVIPFGNSTAIANVNNSILYIYAVSSLGVYGILLSGWASNSKYALLGSIRSAAQMISYEINIGFILLTIIFCTGSLNIGQIASIQIKQGIWFAVPLYPLMVMFIVSILAETNRAPFDLAEAESELVSGYNTEYSGITFALFFLGEYSNIILMSGLLVLIFLGGWDLGLLNSLIGDELCFSIKTTMSCYLFILVRAVLPRYRYDSLMDIGWKVMLPLTLGYLIYTIGIVSFLDGLPIPMDYRYPLFWDNV